jgi:hypothetical protein
MQCFGFGKIGLRLIAVADLSMGELAEWIDLYLKLAEGDPKVNTSFSKDHPDLKRLWHSGAVYTRGPKISVSYISYQGYSHLSKTAAIIYLEKLEAAMQKGKFIRHFEALRGR